MQTPSTARGSSMFSGPWIMRFEWLQKKLGLQSASLTALWLLIAITLVPVTTYVRFFDLENPLMDPHPIRQSQTALTINDMVQGTATLWDYSSPYQGKLWSFVYEFPLYQWITAKVVTLGLPLETSARLVTLAFFALGTWIFGQICLALFPVSVAAFAVLLYFTSPFVTVFSRTCLIDNFTLTMTLASLYFAVRIWKAEKISPLNLSLMTLFGITSSLSKPTIWVAPSLFLGVMALLNLRKDLRKSVAFVSSLFLQLALACLWIVWAGSVRKSYGAPVEDPLTKWVIGAFEYRLVWANWWMILQTTVRGILSDWLFVPLIITLLLPGNYRRQSWIAISVALVSVLLTFRVHMAHDYYQIAESPYWILASALGIYYLDSASRKVRLSFWILIVPLLLHNWAKLPIYFSPVFLNYRTAVTKWTKLQTVTDADELVYATESQQHWYAPLYSKRRMIISDYFPGSGLKPSVFLFGEGDHPEQVLQSEKSFWIDGIGTNVAVIRTQAVGKFQYDSEKHLLVSDIPSSITTEKAVLPLEGKTCSTARHLELSPRSPTLTLTWSDPPKTLQIPFRKTVSIPPNPELCPYRLSN